MSNIKKDLLGKNKKIVTALKKAHSHLGNVIKMVEGRKYCIDILQQNLAVIGLLKSANNKLLERHLNSCFVSAMRGTNEKRKQEMIDEILNISRLSK
jgi:CsoR family transcriptional regulator, copper-sensing transcriptional repressor